MAEEQPGPGPAYDVLEELAVAFAAPGGVKNKARIATSKRLLAAFFRGRSEDSPSAKVFEEVARLIEATPADTPMSLASIRDFRQQASAIVLGANPPDDVKFAYVAEKVLYMSAMMAVNDLMISQKLLELEREPLPFIDKTPRCFIDEGFLTEEEIRTLVLILTEINSNSGAHVPLEMLMAIKRKLTGALEDLLLCLCA